MSRTRAPFGRTRNVRDSSPPLDDFYTGVSDINPDEALHSTLQQLNHTDRELAPHWRNRQRYSDDEGSASMSIELGRGVKRAGDELEDVSSSAVFTFGADNSQYEVVSTPPHKSVTSKKSNGNLKKETLIRRANEGAKRTVSQSTRIPSQARRPDLEDAIRSASYARNTRFVAKKTNAPNLSTIQGGDTATSMALPDVSNIGELINPPNESTFKRPSRFTPQRDFRMPVTFQGTERIPVVGVPIPEDEKKIYAALQTLQDKLTRLEQAHGVTTAQLEQYENENNELRLALAREEQLRRPDSALGSEDESAKEKWRLERTKLRSNITALQNRLARSEQKSLQREYELKTSMKEKDSLVTQLGVECYRVEELEAENVALRQDHDLLRTEVEALRVELQQLRGPQKRSLAQDIHSHASLRRNTTRDSSRKQETPADHTHTKWLDIDFNLLDIEARKNIASSVRQQFEQQRVRQATASLPRSSMFDIDVRPRPQPKPSQRQAPIHRFAPMLQDEHTNEEVYTEFELTKNTQNFTRISAVQQDDDVTNLTPNDPLQTKALRQLLEQERRAGHLRRQSSAPVVSEFIEVPPPAQRRSSLRDPASATNEQTKAARNVRVQSPPADVEPTEQSANISLPVRSAARPQASIEDDEEGHTSAFIIPDITLHRRLSQSEPLDKERLKKHNTAACTVCDTTNINTLSIPALRRVSSRADLPEDATERPSQSPQHALAIVVKQLTDELEHIKLALTKYQKLHNANEPEIGARERKRLYDKISALMAECKKKEDQIYALYDALEGQQAEVVIEQTKNDKTSHSTQSLHLGGFDGAYDEHSDAESIGLPVWEGLSEDEDAP